MFLKLKEISHKHFEKNFFYYFLVVIFLMIGISAGAIITKALDDSQKRELINYLDSFLKILDMNSVDSLLLLKHSLINNLKTVILLWFLGVTIIGIPVILGVVALRGFVIGFTVSFLFIELGFKGFLFALLAILPQNIFLIPGIVVISVISIVFSTTTIKNKSRIKVRHNFFRGLLSYSISIMSVSLLVFLGSLVEAYITPAFMRLIIGYV